MSDTDILARFCALPDYVQRAIETELLDSRGAAPGSALDQVAQARLLAMIEREEKRVAATSEGAIPGGTPEIRENGRPTLPQDRRGGMGGLPQPPRVSAVPTASPSASWYPSTAPRSATTPPTPAATLPADLDEAVAIAIDHARLAQRMGSPKSHVRTILAGYCKTLFERASVRAEFDTLAELEALADYRFHGGVKPRD